MSASSSHLGKRFARWQLLAMLLVIFTAVNVSVLFPTRKHRRVTAPFDNTLALRNKTRKEQYRNFHSTLLFANACQAYTNEIPRERKVVTTHACSAWLSSQHLPLWSETRTFS